MNPLTLTLIWLTTGFLFMLFVYLPYDYPSPLRDHSFNMGRHCAIILTSLIFLSCCCILLYFDFSTPNLFQLIVRVPIKIFYAPLTFGVDGLSLCFVLLTCFIFLLCVTAVYPGEHNNKLNIFVEPKNYFLGVKNYFLCLISIFFFSILAFTSNNLLIFFIFFEAILIPMYILIGTYGSRSRKVYANYYFFLYTVFGSLFILSALIWLTCWLGSSSFNLLLAYNTAPTIVYKTLPLLFFIGFATKIPMIPFHIWLPEAHVEAPTIGSVILASLLLKLGGYGFMRFNLALFPYAGNTITTSSFITCLGVISIIYSSLAAIRQMDIKKIIAYSSVAHMNVVVLGLFSNTIQGVDGAVYLMVAHGIASGALFFCIGVIYDRYHTRLIEYYGGLVQVMPVFVTLFFLFTLANVGFPLTANFVGEFLSFLGIGQQSLVYLFLAATGVVLSAVYSMWLFGRISFGSLKTSYITNFCDLTIHETIIFLPLVLSMIILGVNSDVVLVLINSSYFVY